MIIRQRELGNLETKEENFLAKELDLNELKSLSFGPAWSVSGSEDVVSKKALKQTFQQKREKSRTGELKKRPIGNNIFNPTVEVSFYSEEDSFQTLVKALRASSKTYQLFEIVQVIIQKYDRFFVIIRPQKMTDEDGGSLYISVPDNLPFESENEVVEHVVRNHMDKFFDTEVVTVDPPKGSFQVIARCTRSGVLLGPPNYHLYPQLIREHLNKYFPDQPREVAEKNIVLVKDEDLVKQWLEQMSHQSRYSVKNTSPEKESSEPIVLDSLEQARRYLLTHRKHEVVHSCKSAKLSGVKIDELPKSSNIYQSIQFVLNEQKKFPLETANHLRGRLRKLKFNIYKKGSKGISYVSNAKPRIRAVDQAFAEPVETLIQFIEKHPYIKYPEVPALYLKPENSSATSTECEEASVHLDNEETIKLKELHQNLRWLIEEGYVIRYSDDSLFVRQASQAPEKESLN